MHANSFKLGRRANLPNLDKTMVTLLTVLVGLLILIVLLSCGLILLRHRRKARKAANLPVYNEKRVSTASSVRSYHRRTHARPASSIQFRQDRRLSEESSASVSMPNPLPEIRITFAEEVDSVGRRQSGRVMVVHVGESSLGYEPVTERLPSYQQCGSERFESIDLERAGGITEKETRPSLGWN